VDARGYYGTTAMHLACTLADKDSGLFVALLSRHAADPNLRRTHDDSATPLFCALANNNEMAVLELLKDPALDAGATTLWNYLPLQRGECVLAMAVRSHKCGALARIARAAPEARAATIAEVAVEWWAAQAIEWLLIRTRVHRASLDMHRRRRKQQRGGSLSRGPTETTPVEQVAACMDVEPADLARLGIGAGMFLFDRRCSDDVAKCILEFVRMPGVLQLDKAWLCGGKRRGSAPASVANSGWSKVLEDNPCATVRR